MRNMGIRRRTGIPHNRSYKANKWECIDSSIVTLWFDRDCVPKVLIDDDDLSNSEGSDDDYADDFAINEK